ncbi:MAG: hypothetical protein KDK51_08685, partial [Deltaproteobacteria bacterium]|nr:hypothetical protein [Deltaproteobacteria bacterium]
MMRILKDAVDSGFKMVIKGKSVGKLSQTLEKHPTIRNQLLPYIGLVAGFTFDILTLGRIDQTWSLIQQGGFLLMVFIVLYLHERPALAASWGKSFDVFWKYHESILQFFMGGLLSAYTLFYFKSASSWTVLGFVLFLLLLMFLNEKKGLHDLGFPIRYAMASLCVCSFMIYLFPILFHIVDARIFALSIFASILLYFLWMKLLIPKAHWKTPSALKKISVGVAVPMAFVVLYGCKIIPPVPLAAKKMGVYHDVKRDGKDYVLYYNRPWYLFWQKGDQRFYAAEGDKVYFFASVFAPTSLKHKIYVHWQKRVQEGWQSSDRIPIQIVGG